MSKNPGAQNDPENFHEAWEIIPARGSPSRTDYHDVRAWEESAEHARGVPLVSRHYSREFGRRVVVGGSHIYDFALAAAGFACLAVLFLALDRAGFFPVGNRQPSSVKEG